jgi:hypothetical protein
MRALPFTIFESTQRSSPDPNFSKGNLKIKLVPLPSSLMADIFPPICLTMLNATITIGTYIL